ncbi:hypothetical protein L1887_53555 [Cichorium endivia]|nr:hypothetical protein L1887_53555 [Cichorium endivia]
MPNLSLSVSLHLSALALHNRPIKRCTSKDDQLVRRAEQLLVVRLQRRHLRNGPRTDESLPRHGHREHGCRDRKPAHVCLELGHVSLATQHMTGHASQGPLVGPSGLESANGYGRGRRRRTGRRTANGGSIPTRLLKGQTRPCSRKRGGREVLFEVAGFPRQLSGVRELPGRRTLYLPGVSTRSPSYRLVRRSALTKAQNR